MGLTTFQPGIDDVAFFRAAFQQPWINVFLLSETEGKLAAASGADGESGASGAEGRIGTDDGD